MRIRRETPVGRFASRRGGQGVLRGRVSDDDVAGDDDGAGGVCVMAAITVTTFVLIRKREKKG